MKIFLRILAVVAGALSILFGLMGALFGEGTALDWAIVAFFVGFGALLLFFGIKRSSEEKAEKAARKKEERLRIEDDKARQAAYAREQAVRKMAARAEAAEKTRVAEEERGKQIAAVPQPAKKQSKTLGVVLLVIGVLIALFGIALPRTSGGNVDPQVAPVNHFSGRSEVVNSGEMAAGSSGVKGDGNYGPGDTVSMNGVLITFHGITETLGDGLFKPDDNKIFVIAEFTVENNTGDQINISSVFGSAAYCDNYLVSESMSAELGDPQHRNNLTGSLDTGRKLRGIIGYELPSQWQRLEIRLRTDWWKGSRADEITFLVEAA